MQVKPNKSNKKPIVIAIVILTVLVGVFLTYLYATYLDDTNDSAKDSNKSTQDIETDKNINTPSTEVENSIPDSDDSAPTKVENKTPIQYEGEKPTDSSTGDNEQFRIPEE